MERVRWTFFMKGLKWPLLLAVLVFLFFFSFSIGKYPIGAKDLINTVWLHFTDPAGITDRNMETALFNIRLPRIIAVMLVGAGLSTAGASYQGMFKNPIVSPDILGASAGAGFGAAIGLLFGLSLSFVQFFAFAGGVLAVLCTVLINKTFTKDPLLGLVLGGIMMTNLCSAFTSYVKLIADSDDKLPAITFWLMGGFHAMTNSKLYSIFFPISLSLIILFVMRWKLNVFSFGEEEAHSMGVNTAQVRFFIILAATVITASSVSVAGMVGWVGLVIPHLSRAIVGANFKEVIPASALLGSIYLLVVDNIARNLFPVEIPIGILTAVLGVPFFLFIYRSNAKR